MSSLNVVRVVDCGEQLAGFVSQHGLDVETINGIMVSACVLTVSGKYVDPILPMDTAITTALASRLTRTLKEHLLANLEPTIRDVMHHAMDDEVLSSDFSLDGGVVTFSLSLSKEVAHG